MGEKGQIWGVRSPRNCSRSWGLRNYLQMSGPQIRFCPNDTTDRPKGPEFPLNNCIMLVLCFSWGYLVTNVKQMWSISPGSPKAFQEVIYSFWTGQNQPCLRTQRASTSFKFKGQKCVNADARGEGKAIQSSLGFVLEMGLCFSSNPTLLNFVDIPLQQSRARNRLRKVLERDCLFHLFSCLYLNKTWAGNGALLQALRGFGKGCTALSNVPGAKTAA